MSRPGFIYPVHAVWDINDQPKGREVREVKTVPFHPDQMRGLNLSIPASMWVIDGRELLVHHVP